MSEQPPNANGGTAAWRLQQVEKKVEQLEGKVDRLTMAIVGGALTVAISVIVFTVTYLASGPAP